MHLKFRVKNHRLGFLERAEIKDFLNACRSAVRPVFATLIWTGMRKSECFILNWQDVDLKRRIIRLLDTKDSKTQEIPITKDLHKLLTKIPRHISSPYVFCQRNGKPWKDFRGSLEAEVKKTGIEKHVTLLTLRHTEADPIGWTSWRPF